jgi:hypothetical protein
VRPLLRTAVALLGLATAGAAACTSSSKGEPAGAPEAGVEAGQDATLDTTAPVTPIDAPCFGPVGTFAPDAQNAIVYGSCIPHLADAASPTCYESGHVGDVPDAGGMPGTLKAACTGAPVDGTWSTKPCDTTGAVFGCQTVLLVGDACSTVTTTWYFPPATGSDELAYCPLPFTVVGP